MCAQDTATTVYLQQQSPLLSRDKKLYLRCFLHFPQPLSFLSISHNKMIFKCNGQPAILKSEPQ